MKTKALVKIAWPLNIKGLLAAACALPFLLLATPVGGAGSQRLHGHVPAAVANVQPVERFAVSNHLNLAIGLPLRNRQALTNLLRQIYDPASPNYHHFLTSEQFTEKFGPTKKDYQAVIAFAQARGLTVTGTHPNRMLVDVEGAVANIEKALHVTMRVYQHPKEARKFYAPDMEPSLDLSVPVLSIGGLDNYSLPRPRFQFERLNNVPQATPNSGSGPNGGYMGSDFRAAYAPDVTLNGSGQVVGLLQFDGYTASDITYYENQAGLPSVTLSNVLIDGASGNPSGGGGEVEVCLDIEMAISLAPGLSKVMVYMAPNPSPWEDLLNRMANDNVAKQLSCSWYQPGGAAKPTCDQIFQQMAAQGQSFFNASGDYDAYTGLIDFPGDTPYLTQVGGTTLFTTGPEGAWTSETVWNRGNGIGSGGGISTQYPIPSWQTNINMTANQGSTTMRNTPDVALTAENVYVRADGLNYRVGGTSCAAPLWAGFAALINQLAVASGKPTVGFINPAVSALGAKPNYVTCFHDITTGNNTRPGSPTKFYAVTGYDLCTGWGTPAGQSLINALANPEALLITPVTGFASIGGVGGPFTITSQSLTLTNAGTNSLTWTLANTSIWLNASPSSGTLVPGGPAAAVTVSLNTAASNLLVGTYSATLWFTNQNSGVGQGRQFALSVISPPTITAQPTDQAVLEGATAAFTVEATGGLPLYYQWQDNGTNLTDGDNISGSTTTNLTINHVSPADVGTYSVIVTNFAGAVTSSNALLTITPSPPVIILQPADQTAVVGQTAAFTVAAIGSTPFFYQWSFNETNLIGATNATLTLTNVQLTLAGSYAVEVSNVLGSATSSNAMLTVYTVPVITSFSPQSGAAGTVVNVSGLNFDPTPGNNIVYFGAVQAMVTAASETNLVVTVPAGATYAPITETVNGLTAYANSPFLVSFTGSGVINSSSLTSRVDLASGNGPFAVVIADLDEDGRPDLAVDNGSSGTISIYRNISTNGSLTAGSFAPRVDLATGTSSPRGMVAADVDGDGKLDLVVAEEDGNKVVVFRNLCTPGNIITNSFAPPVYYPVVGTPRGVAVQDLDGDGRPEIVTANWNNNTVSVLWNIGTVGSITTNSFALAVNFGAGTGPQNVAIADVDGDGKADVVTVNNNSGSSSAVSVLRNLSALGDIALATNVDLAGPNGSYSVAAADLDGDGKLDLAVSSQGGEQLSVYRNVSTPGSITTNSFAGRVDFAVGGWGNALAMGDLDGDGKPDAAVVTQMPDHLSLFKNTSTPGSFTNSSFAARVDFSAGWNPNGVAIGDLDGDGRPDIVFANCYSATVSVYQNIVSFGGPPSITSQPTDQTVFVGGTATFNVTASGTAPLSYQWNFNGTNINGAANTSLTLTNVQLNQAGNYAVLVTNALGSVLSSNAVLTVNLPPPCAPGPSGLVSWWPGEGNANDVIGVNNGTLVGGASFAAGEVGQAFSFNGSNGYVSIPDSPSLDAFTTSITIELWLKADQLTANSDWKGIVTKGNSSWRLQATSEAKTVYLGLTGLSPNGDLYGSRNVNDGQWHHVAAVYDGTNMFLYVDGTLDVSQPATGLIAQNSDPACIGANAKAYVPSCGCNEPGYFFNGLIDEVSIYNRALTALEIQTIYAAGSGGKCPPAPTPPSITSQPTDQTVFVGGTATFNVTASGTAPLSYRWNFNGTNIAGATNATLFLTNVQFDQAGNYAVLVTNLYGSVLSSNALLTVNLPSTNCTPAPAGMVAWWRAEGNANDSIGTNNGTPTGGITYTNGEVGQAFVFNNTTSYIPVPASPSLNIGTGSGITIECWIQPASANILAPIVEWDSSSTDGLQLWVNGSLDLAVNIKDKSGNAHKFNTVNGILTTNNFQHVALTYNKSSGLAVLYYNGAAVTNANFGSITPQTTYPVNIGRRTGQPIGNGDTYGGLMDELSLYNRALSPNEISAIYSAGIAGKCFTPAPPTIISQPTNQTVYLGITANFNVVASGTPPLIYQWNFNGTNIVGATNTMLTLTNVQFNQAGNYQVLVTNLYGSILSSNAVLTVIPSGACTPAPSGLVSWWRAEGNANDSIGTNNGTPTGGITYTNGEVGQAFVFNNTSSYIPVPASPSLNIGTNNGFTIECWIQPNAFNVNGSGAPIIEWDSATTDGLQLWSQGVSSLAVNIKDKSGNAHKFNTVNGILTTNNFQHVALTYNKSSGLAVLYYNGAAVTNANFGSITPQTTYPVNIGRRTGQPIGNGDTYGGLMDELSLYNRALSSNEIAAIYNAGSEGKCPPVPPSMNTQPTNQTVAVGGTATFSVTASGTPPLSYQWNFDGTNIAGATNTVLTLTNVQVTQAGNYAVLVTNAYGSILSSNALLTVNPPPSCDPAPSGLVSWWRAESNANDSIGTNNGTLLNGVTFTNGVVGQGFHLNGTNQSVQIADSPALKPTNVTVETWIKLDTEVTPGANSPGQQVIVFKKNSRSSAFEGYDLLKNRVSGQDCFTFGIASAGGYQVSVNSTTVPQIGVWYHVAGSYDGSNVKLYVNGVQEGSAYAGFPLDYGTRPVFIGQEGEFWNGWVGGTVDEVSIYNRALTALEIQTIYAAGSGGKCPPTPPSITTQPTNQTVTVGSTATFSVAASGTPPLSYQWNFNGTNISQANNTTLTLTNVQLNQAGNYAVLVTNAYGSVTSSNALLTVLTVNPPATNVPVIFAFSPISGIVGTSVTITGTNFSLVAANNIVYFGAVQATVTAASETNLVVTVQAGATYAPITETVNGLTAYANSPFLVSFTGSGVINSSSLTSRVDLASGNGPFAVVIADLDGDGKPDLAVNNYSSGTISIYRNISTNGTLTAGSFAPRVDLATSTSSPLGMVAADVDGDGKLDLVLVDGNANQVVVLRNLSTPGSLTTNSFGAPMDFPVGPGPSGVAVHDMDGDGKPEIVAANYGGTTVSVLRNIGTMGSLTTNSFAPAVSFTVGPTPVNVMIADVDGDGKADVVTANNGNSSQAMSVLRNLSTLGNMAFATNIDFPGLPTSYSLAIGDLDGDGKLDVVVGSQPNGQAVSVFRNTSTPGSITTDSFAPHVDFAAGGWANSVAIGDLDGDGKPDVAVVTQLPDQLSLFKNMSTPGSFTSSSLAARVDFSAGWNPNGVAIGDLDGDGRPDIIFGNQYDSTISIYQNAVPFGGPPPCVPPPSGLVSWWPGEGNANDIIGTNNGMLENVAFTNGMVGQGFYLNGSNADVQIPDSASLKPASVTVETWVRLDALASPVAAYPGLQYIIFKQNTRDGNFEGYDLEKNRIDGQDVFRFQVTSADGTQVPAASTTIPQVGVWYHLAGTYDNSSGYVKLYVNGVLEGSAYAGFPLDYGTHPVFIGTTGQPEWDGRVQGTVDEVSIYNRALSSNEIASIYSAGSVGKCAPVAPVILSQPTNQTVTVGSTAIFSVTATGLLPLSYQWSFNGTNISGATNTRLTLTNVQLNQAGNYQVLVTNLYGYILSSNAVLMVTLDHFAWDSIPSPRFVNTPFAVTIRAQDPTNGIFTNFTGIAILGSTNGISVNPPVSGNFVQGVWTGAVMISQTASNLVLQADDGLGHFGLANPINVISLPRLEMLHSGNIALFIWPVGYSGFVLETSGNLSPATWAAVPYPPIPFGDEYFLPLNMTGTNGFYRLRFSSP